MTPRTDFQMQPGLINQNIGPNSHLTFQLLKYYSFLLFQIQFYPGLAFKMKWLASRSINTVSLAARALPKIKASV